MRRENRNRCVLIFFDVDIISKFSGESRGKIGRVLVSNLQESDKVQVEDVKNSDEEALARAARSWYWDVSNCGPTIKILSDGITACLKEDKDEDKATIWEYKYPTGQKANKWIQFSSYDASKMEECELRSLWKSGQQQFQCEGGKMTVYINGSIAQNPSNGEVYVVFEREARYCPIPRIQRTTLYYEYCLYHEKILSLTLNTNARIQVRQQGWSLWYN